MATKDEEMRNGTGALAPRTRFKAHLGNRARSDPLPTEEHNK